MSRGDRVTQVTLRALEGQPLERAAVREIVLATARAIAERQGIELVDLRASSGSVRASLLAGQIEAIGFAAELRRITAAWYKGKFGVSELWGRRPQDDVQDDVGDDVQDDAQDDAQHDVDDDDHDDDDDESWKQS